MNNNETLNNRIRSGEYFEEAFFWHAEKYLAPRSHFTYVLVAFLITAFAAFTAFETAGLQHSKDERAFPIYTDDAVNDFYRIKRLTEKYEALNISVARYLLAKYVTAREQYISYDLTPEVWQDMLNVIRESSSRKVFNQYVKDIDPVFNSNSPILKYKMQVSRLIQILSINFQEDTDRPNYADVSFLATEKGANEEISTYWVARINFSMPEINNVLDKKSTLDFIVTSYSTREAKRG